MMIPPFALAFTWLVVPFASKRDPKAGKKLLHGKRKSSIVRSSSLQASGDDNDGGASGGGLEFLDCHHHFYDTMNNDFSFFLKDHFPNESYLPYEYYNDVVEPIEDSERLAQLSSGRRNIRHVGSVHIELMPDDGLDEVWWVEDVQIRTQRANDNPYVNVQAMVASCDLADPDLEAVRRNLEALQDFSPKVKGIRWILDCEGPRFDESGKNVVNPATPVANLRHDGIDYLNDDQHQAESFAKGYALLADCGFSFDLHCSPKQLQAAAQLCANHPNIPVVINHLGRPFRLFGENNSEMMPDEAKLDEWREGMRAMAKLPHVHVKISGLGWAIPNWTASARRKDLVKKLCQETVQLFGPERCMIGTNWWMDGGRSDGGSTTDGPSADEYLEYMLDFFGGLTPKEQQLLFAGTAKKFYKIE